MRILNNPIIDFGHVDCDRVEITAHGDGNEIVQLDQDGGLIWIPLADAIAFAEALKTFAQERS